MKMVENVFDDFGHLRGAKCLHQLLKWRYELLAGALVRDE